MSSQGRAETGRAEAFDDLVSRYARLMASAIRRVCGRRHGHLAPDAQQETYVALWKRLAAGNGIEHPASYTYKVAFTSALAVLRRHARGAGSGSLDDGDGGEAAAVPARGAAGGLEQEERAQLLRELLERLPEEQALALRGYLAGFNHRELAQLHGWSEAVARHRVYRSIEALRALIRDER